MKNTTVPLVTVYALMYANGHSPYRSLVAIFSAALKAERFAKGLRKKLDRQAKMEGAAYFVDAWHVDGAR